MRKRALLAWSLLFAAFAAPGLAADPMLTGKPATWENWGEAPSVASVTSLVVESQETPNQRRQRLGIPLESSFPAQDVGEAQETPNQRRARLGTIAEAPMPEYYAQDAPEIDEESNDRLAKAQ